MGINKDFRNVEAVLTRSVYEKVELTHPHAIKNASIDMAALTATSLEDEVARSAIIPSSRSAFERVTMGKGSGSIRGM